MYIDLRPDVSEKLDHHKGKIAMESIYNATAKFTTVAEVLKSLIIPSRTAAEY